MRYNKEMMHKVVKLTEIEGRGYKTETLVEDITYEQALWFISDLRSKFNNEMYAIRKM